MAEASAYREYYFTFREWAKAHRISLSILPQPKGWVIEAVSVSLDRLQIDKRMRFNNPSL